MDEAFLLTSKYNLIGFSLKCIKGAFICIVSSSYMIGFIPAILLSASRITDLPSNIWD